jgi:hypothetical protein
MKMKPSKSFPRFINVFYITSIGQRRGGPTTARFATGRGALPARGTHPASKQGPAVGPADQAELRMAMLGLMKNSSVLLGSNSAKIHKRVVAAIPALYVIKGRIVPPPKEVIYG